MKNLELIFNPKSIAVVGASRRAGSVGNDIAKNLVKSFPGSVFLVNPKAKRLLGQPCYPDLAALKKRVDLLVIAVPAAVVAKVLRTGAQLGIKNALVISAGFKEAGRADLEAELVAISEEYKINLIGPNCLGVICPDKKMNASFAALMPPKGGLAFITQSGALGTAFLDVATNLGLGFSKFISIGNKAVIDEADLLEYLKKDKTTRAIGIYSEQLSSPDKLLKQFRALTAAKSPKPVVILKSGRTSAGAGASTSHTGALAGNDASYEALFNQGGVIRARTVKELFDYLRIFYNNPLAPAGKIALVTNAGGPGVLAVDVLVERGLKLASLSKKTQSALKKVLPSSASLANPVDILGDASANHYQESLKILNKDKNVEAFLVILTPQSMTEIEATAQALIAFKKKTKRPLAAVFMGQELSVRGRQQLCDNGVAVYAWPEAAARSLATLDDFNKRRKIKRTAPPIFKDLKKETVQKILKEAQAQGLKSLPEPAVQEIMRAYGLPVLESYSVSSVEQAEKIAKKINTPLALKIISPDILHKSDADGVLLNVSTKEVGRKYQELIKRVKVKKPKAKISGVLISPMVSGGQEMIIGSVREPSLGATIMVGLGGIYAEILNDVAFGLNPLTKTDVKLMLAKLKSAPLLAGARGKKPLDQEALIQSILRLAQLVKDWPEIKEIDINPLVIKEQGAVALDGRIIIG